MTDRTEEFRGAVKVFRPAVVNNGGASRHPSFDEQEPRTEKSEFFHLATSVAVGFEGTAKLIGRLNKLVGRKGFSNNPAAEISDVMKLFEGDMTGLQRDIASLLSYAEGKSRGSPPDNSQRQKHYQHIVATLRKSAQEHTKAFRDALLLRAAVEKQQNDRQRIFSHSRGVAPATQLDYPLFGSINKNSKTLGGVSNGRGTTARCSAPPVPPTFPPPARPPLRGENGRPPPPAFGGANGGGGGGSRGSSGRDSWQKQPPSLQGNGHYPSEAECSGTGSGGTGQYSNSSGSAGTGRSSSANGLRPGGLGEYGPGPESVVVASKASNSTSGPYAAMPSSFGRVNVNGSAAISRKGGRLMGGGGGAAAVPLPPTEQFKGGTGAFGLRKRPRREDGSDAAEEDSRRAAWQVQVQEDSKSRVDESHKVEKMIGDLGQMFSRFSTMVAAQEEVVMHIEDDVEAAHAFAEEGQAHLAKYYHIMSGNRGIIVKVFIMLIVFIWVFLGLMR